MTARKQTSDLMKRRDAAKPSRHCRRRLVEKIGKLAQARLACDSNQQENNAGYRFVGKRNPPHTPATNSPRSGGPASR